jgi:hypothetical protein
MPNIFRILLCSSEVGIVQLPQNKSWDQEQRRVVEAEISIMKAYASCHVVHIRKWGAFKLLQISYVYDNLGP